MQTHDTPLLPLKNTTRNTYLLLFLNILLKRLIHQFNVIRHGFIQINKFFHLSMGNNSHAIGIAVFCKILPGEQMGKDEIQFIQRGTYKQITITRDFLFIRQSVQLLYRACRERLLYGKGGLPTGRIFFLAKGHRSKRLLWSAEVYENTLKQKYLSSFMPDRVLIITALLPVKISI